jgi:hypothetical protein
MDCRIESCNDEHKIVLAAHLRPSCAHHHASKDSPSREKAEGGGAPKGACIHVRASQTSFRSLRNPSARGSGPTSGAARLPALRGGACQSDRTLRLSRAALHAKERAPALPAPSIALKRSTPHPGRSAAGDDARARERGYEPRPQEPHPLHQSAVTGGVPRTNGHCAGNINGDECQRKCDSRRWSGGLAAAL